jgi:hypothetical protein
VLLSTFPPIARADGSDQMTQLTSTRFISWRAIGSWV